MKICGRNGDVQRWLIALISAPLKRRGFASVLPSTNVHRRQQTSFYIDISKWIHAVSLLQKRTFNDDVCPSRETDIVGCDTRIRTQSINYCVDRVQSSSLNLRFNMKFVPRKKVVVDHKKFNRLWCRYVMLGCSFDSFFVLDFRFHYPPFTIYSYSLPLEKQRLRFYYKWKSLKFGGNLKKLSLVNCLFKSIDKSHKKSSDTYINYNRTFSSKSLFWSIARSHVWVSKATKTKQNVSDVKRKLNFLT